MRENALGSCRKEGWKNYIFAWLNFMEMCLEVSCRGMVDMLYENKKNFDEMDEKEFI